MIEKLYGNIPRYGKSYFTENFDEINKIVKENEQLKQFKEKVFTLIDKEIARNEEAIELGKKPVPIVVQWDFIIICSRD